MTRSWGFANLAAQCSEAEELHDLIKSWVLEQLNDPSRSPDAVAEIARCVVSQIAKDEGLYARHEQHTGGRRWPVRAVSETYVYFPAGVDRVMREVGVLKMEIRSRRDDFIVVKREGYMDVERKGQASRRPSTWFLFEYDSEKGEVLVLREEVPRTRFRPVVENMIADADERAVLRKKERLKKTG